jgi:thiamine biosynthesis lipoprotein
MPARAARTSFDAMGVEIVVGGAGQAELDSVRALYDEWDRVFSRFRSESELSAVNRSTERILEVSPLFARACEIALQAAEATGGLVDPTLGEAVEAAGYDRDFAELEDSLQPAGPPQPGRWHELKLVDRMLFRPAGLRLDLNGVVKGLAVDAAAALLHGEGFVSAGGDVAVRGSAVVELPGRRSLLLRSGGIATSGSATRRWLRGGERQHHLIDPRTGRPSDSCWVEVSVAAGSCIAADVAAKAAFLLSAEGPDWLDARALPGLFHAHDGSLTANRSWQRLLGTEAAA